LFNILPVFFDIITALLIFYFKFGPALALLIFAVMATYVLAMVNLPQATRISQLTF
jgi:ABC-type transport system involved in Fe-S cluster assembly fused permease/ATPase subunit